MERENIAAVLAIQERTGFQHWTAAQFLSELSQSYTLAFVLKNDTLVLGFAIWHLLGEEAELCSIAIDTTEQKRGLGTFMLRTMHEQLHLAGATRFFLEVRADNAAALTLYRKLGYVQQGLRRKYYSDGETALLMAYGVPCP
jgi:ribosomal-protein-alanine acetyltransferase